MKGSYKTSTRPKNTEHDYYADALGKLLFDFIILSAFQGLSINTNEIPLQHFIYFRTKY